MVLKLVFRWPKPVFVMVLGAMIYICIYTYVKTKLLVTHFADMFFLCPSMEVLLVSLKLEDVFQL